MSRTKRIALALCLGSLLACTGTRTGNPGLPEGGSGAPMGAIPIRSQLARDEQPQVQPEARGRLQSDNQRFAFNLYGRVAAEPGNLFFSPYSISVALALAYAGAEGETEREIAEALQFTLPEPELHEAFNATDLALEASSQPVSSGGTMRQGLELSIVNGIFARKRVEYESDYLDVLALNYDSGLYALDFGADPEGSRNAINDWVAEQTKRRIEELLPPGSIDPNVWLVLANAIYFKAEWLDQFDPAETADAAFHAPAADVNVPMMHATQGAMYAEGDGWQALELKYVPETTRMMLILPAAGRMSDIENLLDPEFLASIRQAMGVHVAEISLPRFTYRTELELKQTLSALGMPTAFTDDADFSGIVSDGDIQIGEVYHQAFVALDEQGTEAAASTAAVFAGRSAPPPAVITFDRPFLFLIQDLPTGQILFVGRVTDPG